MTIDVLTADTEPLPRSLHPEEPGVAHQVLLAFQKPLQQRLRIPNIRRLMRLGSGTYGTAFAIDDKRVLKVTRDESEAQASANLIGEQLEHIARFYDVFRFGDTFTWGIVQERLQPMDNVEHVAVDEALFETSFRIRLVTNGGDVLRALTDIMDEAEAGEMPVDVALTSIRTLTEEVHVEEMWEELTAYNIRFIDYHSGNIMKRGDRFVITDLGASRSPRRAIRQLKAAAAVGGGLVDRILSTIDDPNFYDEWLDRNIESQHGEERLAVELRNAWSDIDPHGEFIGDDESVEDVDDTPLIDTAFEALRERFRSDYAANADCSHLGTVTAWRVLFVPDVDAFLQELQSGRKMRGLGIYWTWSTQLLDSPWEKGGVPIVIEASVPEASVDVMETALANMHTATFLERELTMKPGSMLSVRAVYERDTGDDRCGKLLWRAPKSPIVMTAELHEPLDDLISNAEHVGAVSLVDIAKQHPGKFIHFSDRPFQRNHFKRIPSDFKWHNAPGIYFYPIAADGSLPVGLYGASRRYFFIAELDERGALELADYDNDKRQMRSWADELGAGLQFDCLSERAGQIGWSGVFYRAVRAAANSNPAQRDRIWRRFADMFGAVIDRGGRGRMDGDIDSQAVVMDPSIITPIVWGVLARRKLTA